MVMGVMGQWVLGLGALGLGLLGWRACLTVSRRHGAMSLVPALLMLGLALRLVVAFGTPDFYAPDEQSHFNYVKFLAEQHALPVQVHQTDSPTNDWEYYQPPLYYLAQVPVYLVAQAIFGEAMQHATVVALRLFSVALWGVAAWSALRFLRALNIHDELLSVSVVGMVSLLPSYVFSSAAINNDNLVLALGAAFLVVLARGDLSWRAASGAGLLLGLAALAKFSAVVYAVALVAVVCCRQLALPRPSWGKALAYLLIVGGVSALVVSPWIARNLAVYGSATAESVANIPFDWEAVWRSDAVKAVLHMPEGWGWLWYVLLVPVLLLYTLLTFCAVSGIHNNVHGIFPFIGFVMLCLAWRGLRGSRRGGMPLFEGELRPFMQGMAWAIGVNLLLVTRFALMYEQGQGRFLFPLLVPLAILIGAGVSSWRRDDKAAHVAGFFSAYALSFVAYSLATFPRVA